MERELLATVEAAATSTAPINSNAARISEVQIVNIADYPEHLQTVLAWHRAEWAVDESWASYTAHSRPPDRIPEMYVALHDGAPIGTSCIHLDDLPTRKDLSPWLAGVYVHPEWRSAGIGQLLTTYAMQRAAALGLTELYLFVYHAGLKNFYSKLGWTLASEERYLGEPIFIMRWSPL